MRYLIFFFVFAVGFGLFYLIKSPFAFPLFVVDDIQEQEEVTVQGIVQSVIEDTKVLAPPPIRAVHEVPQTVLTRGGVIIWTNTQRAQQGIPELRENTELNFAAERKATDIFAQQYFEHVSPTGVDAGDLARATGYDYLAIGENLALGNYEDDRTIVQAWLDSPGHRENILAGHFEEIGVAVKKGVFEGRETWVGVQIFARPASSCPMVDGNILSSIEAFETRIEEMSVSADTLREELEEQHPQTREQIVEYRREVREYNAFVKQINELINEVGELVDSYNAQVRVFNTCVAQ
jgi:uncharacterized protein YkwD